MANSNNDDLFSPLPPIDNASNPNTPYNTPYSPPPYGQPPRKGPNPVLMIILGVLIGMACLCAACLALSGGTIAAILGNPTVQALGGTFQSGIGTMGAIADLPDTYPSSADDQGSIRAGDTKTITSVLTNSSWTYNGSANEEITVTADAGSNGFATIAVYGTDNRALKKAGLALNANSVSVNTLNVTLPSDGTYHIVVGGAAQSITVRVTSNAR
jgi:hypothetical protein